MIVPYAIFIALLLALPLWIKPLLVYGILPLKVWRRQKLPLDRSWRDGIPENLPPIVREQVERCCAALTAAGFEQRLALHAKMGADKVAPTMVMMIHPQTREIASLLSAQTARLQAVAVSIIDEYDDGSALVTGMNATITFMPKDPSRRTINARFLDNAATLLAFHRARRKLHQLEHLSRRSVFGEPRAYFDQGFQREVTRMESIGYIHRRPSSVTADYTLRGAFAAVVRTSEPHRSRRAAEIERAARDEWTRSGMAVSPVPAADAVDALPPPMDAVPIAAADDLPLREFRVQPRESGLHIALGGTRRRQELLSLWPALLWLLVIAVLLLPSVITVWQYHLTTGRWNAGYWVIRRIWPWLALLVISIVVNVVSLLFGLRRRRGPFHVIVNAHGLAYRDSGAKPRADSIDRRSIRGISIIKSHGRAYRRDSAICVHRYVGRPIVLLRHRDRAALTMIRNQIAGELGFDQMPMADRAFPVGVPVNATPATSDL